MSAIIQGGNPASDDGSAIGPIASNGAILYDEQSYLASGAIDGVPYLIVTTDGREITGRAGRDGLLPRIQTAGKGVYTVYWADEALARTKGEQHADHA